MPLPLTHVAALSFMATMGGVVQNGYDRSGRTLMGGSMQKIYSKGGARLSLLVSKGESSTSSVLPDICRSADGVTGIIYQLKDGRTEVIAEGEREALEGLLGELSTACGDAEVREAWQLPVGGYSDFPLVSLEPKMGAHITLRGEDGALDYFSRHVRIEAVFNRGLKLIKNERTQGTLTIEASGDSARLKSFVRWCYAGPPLARADEVSLEWSS